jgi:hypothetical protein
VNEPLRTTLADAVTLLSSRGISYALIGGLAASLRGQPRVTADVDMVIAVDVAAALDLAATLGGSPFMPLFDDVTEVIQRAFILPLRHRATGVKVDLAIGLSGFERQVIARANVEALASQSVSVATAEDLVIMKVLAGRPQDDQDVEGMLIAQADKLDWGYCLQVAGELGVAIGQDLVQRINSFRNRSDNLS